MGALGRGGAAEGSCKEFPLLRSPVGLGAEEQKCGLEAPRGAAGSWAAALGTGAAGPAAALWLLGVQRAALFTLQLL